MAWTLEALGKQYTFEVQHQSSIKIQNVCIFVIFFFVRSCSCMFSTFQIYLIDFQRINNFCFDEQKLLHPFFVFLCRLWKLIFFSLGCAVEIWSWFEGKNQPKLVLTKLWNDYFAVGRWKYRNTQPHWIDFELGVELT